MQEKTTPPVHSLPFFDSCDSFCETNSASTSIEPEFVFGDIPSEPTTPHSTSSSKEFKSDLIEQIIQMCISYSLISSLFNYTVRCDELLSHFSIDFKHQCENSSNTYAQTANNIFDLCVHNLYMKALNNFQKFAEKCKAIFIRESNKSMFEDFQRLTFFINNFKNIFLTIFPKKGTMVQVDNENREDALLPKLNLIGADVVDCLNESVFKYEPTYEFRKDGLDFEMFHKKYMKYVNEYHEGYLEMSEENVNEIKSLKYFLQVSCVMNMYKFLLSVMNLNFEEYAQGKGIDMLQHVFDRIEFHNLANEKVEESEEVDDEDEFDDFGVLVM